eukprot:TRINITY_DN5698_c0_g1_i1.p1 TRINITY_DN5698_c0_g1~~TRINITY_DN5698_c0_g1_i1.p1  ORF type:complete len:278 (+),score=-36.24 TRINITY_DN5698_c0_g1_i1:55-834(+)
MKQKQTQLIKIFQMIKYHKQIKKILTHTTFFTLKIQNNQLINITQKMIQIEPLSIIKVVLIKKPQIISITLCWNKKNNKISNYQYLLIQYYIIKTLNQNSFCSKTHNSKSNYQVEKKLSLCLIIQKKQQNLLQIFIEETDKSLPVVFFVKYIKYQYINCQYINLFPNNEVCFPTIRSVGCKIQLSLNFSGINIFCKVQITLLHPNTKRNYPIHIVLIYILINISIYIYIYICTIYIYQYSQYCTNISCYVHSNETHNKR